MPPAAVVAVPEAPGPGKRPIAVTIAVVLLMVHVAVGMFGHLAAWQRYLGASMTDLFVLGVQAVKWLSLALIAYLLWHGRHSGRVLLSVMLVLSALSLLTIVWSTSRLPGGLKYAHSLSWLALMLRPAAIYLTSLVLVFIPGRAWFRRGVR
jgi:hypothetical protein